MKPLNSARKRPKGRDITFLIMLPWIIPFLGLLGGLIYNHFTKWVYFLQKLLYFYNLQKNVEYLSTKLININTCEIYCTQNSQKFVLGQNLQSLQEVQSFLKMIFDKFCKSYIFTVNFVKFILPNKLFLQTEIIWCIIFKKLATPWQRAKNFVLICS